MADQHKITMEFGQARRVARESFYTLIDFSSQSSLQAACASINRLLQYRAQLLFDAAYFMSVSIASEVNRASSWLLGVGSTPWPDKRSGGIITVPKGGQRATSPSSPDARAAMMRNCVIVEQQYDFGHRKSRRYLAGVPEGALGQDLSSGRVQLQFQEEPAWFSDLGVFGGYVTNGSWYLKAKNRTAPYNQQDVYNLVVAASSPAQVGVVLPGSLDTAVWHLGSRVDLSHFRPRRGQCPCPSINRRWVVASVNQTLIPGFSIVYLRGSETIDPTVYEHLGSIQLVNYTYYTVDSFNPVSGGVHNRGSGFTLRGKRKSRCCTV